MCSQSLFLVQKVIDGIENGESWVVMPALLRVIPYVFRFLPPEVYDWLMDLMGGNDSMKTFQGRNPKKEQ